MEEDIKNMSKEELLEYLEDISKQLNNIALDQIQFAISELQFFKERYKELEEENKSSKETINILTNKLEKVVEENKQLQIDKALQIQMNKRLIEEGIPISVIQNKIDEYLSFDNEHKTYTKDGRENFTMEYFKAKTLQELLDLKE